MRAQYQVLEAMGVPLWHSRNQALIFDSKGPLYCATCLVIVANRPVLGSPSDIILKGMVKVLGLLEEQICLATLSPDLDFQVLKEELIRMAPLTILVMGIELNDRFQGFLGSETKVQVTYDPTELFNQPQLKSKAYQDLLALKEALSTMGDLW